MSTGRDIRSYDYVNRPYERVRDALRQNALKVFQSATKPAACRAQSVATELHSRLWWNWGEDRHQYFCDKH
jgi:hypothetical protein